MTVRAPHQCLFGLVLAVALLPLQAKADWVRMPGQYQQVSVGSATQIYAVNQGSIARYVNGAWAPVTGSLVNVSVAADGTVWGVNSLSALYCMPAGGTWGPIPAPAGVTPLQVSVGNAASVWMVSTTGAIFQWSGSSWAAISGSLSNVSVGSDGTVIGVNRNGGVYQYIGNNQFKAWPVSPGAPFVLVSYGNPQTLWALAGDGTPYQWKGTGWTAVPGHLTNLACGADGTVRGLDGLALLAWQPPRECSLTTDCNGHATAVNLSSDGLSCLCSCRNQWSGRSCAVCPTNMTGADCDRCADGFTNYPACTAIVPGPDATPSACAAKCSSENCAGSAIVTIGGVSACTCSSCTQTTAPRTCGVGPGSVKQFCVYPTNKCMVMSGRDSCVINVSGTNTWAACGACP